MKHAAFIIALVALGACTPATNGDSAGGDIMHYGGVNSLQALGAAQEHCNAFGKAAQLTDGMYSGDRENPSFDCVAR
jgi:hypothetical protein